MAIERKKITEFCQSYLKVNEFQDDCYNGLQVEGFDKISKIITGVSFSTKLIGEAIKREAQMLIVHHGIYNKNIEYPVQIKGVLRGRLKLLLKNDINLCGFHLPLDAHPVIGNNVSLCKLLGIENLKPFYVGFVGDIEKEMDFSDFVELVNSKLGVKSYTIAAGPEKIRRIGVVSGSAPNEYTEAKELGADTYVCGAIREANVRAIEEDEMNFINAGHYNTEKLGIQNLGNLIKKEFDVEVEFVDIPCDI